ncbi:hypothetical protein ACFXHA_45250 [Nocardia sp. NPDC059240]|uniref:hypothetical protein n=1 Tax=Nocardia sp. NPDC059240 TaxID=3346786 RepID=UPI003685D091
MPSIGEYFSSVRIGGVDEGIADDGVTQSLQATPADSSLELPIGPPGNTGPKGPQSYPFRWEGDIADQRALAAIATGLGPIHAGKAWHVKSTNSLAYWNGTTFDTFADAFGAHGPTGQPNQLTLGTVTTGAAGTQMQITVTGTPPNQTVNFVVPRGVKGRKGPIGPPGPISAAADFDSTITRADGMIPMWNAATSKWTPSRNPNWRGPWTINDALRYDGGPGFVADNPNITAVPYQIASLPIPAQDVAWRPFVTGGVIACTTSDKSGERVVLHAALPDNTIVAYGDGHGWAVLRHLTLVPHIRTTAQNPTSTVGVVPAGQATSIIVRIDATTNAPPITYGRAYSHLAVWAVPVTGAPA